MIEEFKGIIPDDSYFLDLPDCICGPEDYKEKIENGIALMGGNINLTSFDGKKAGKVYQISVVVNDQAFYQDIQEISDFVDAENLIILLNTIKASFLPSDDRSFYALSGEFIDFSIMFITPVQKKELAAQGLIYIQ